MKRRQDPNVRLVFTSDGSSPQKPDARSTPPAGDGVVRIRRETKKRRGKTVTVVTGVPLAAAELRELAKELKKLCGTGGSVTDEAIEIQGDHVATLERELTNRGFTVKRAGGEMR